jgi:hypothetical protein
MCSMPKLVFKGTAKPWYPDAVHVLENHLEGLFKTVPGIAATRLRGLVKNIAYTLQYLELLVQIDEDIALSAVLQTMNHKSFIIHGCAVIEAIFYYLLLRAGKITTTEWESASEQLTNVFALSNVSYRHRVILERRISPKPEQMTFHSMLKKVEHSKLTGLDNSFHANLPFLKKLRNRVHIQGIENAMETDYLAINPEHYIKMRNILLQLLMSPLFSNPPNKKYPKASFAYFTTPTQ